MYLYALFSGHEDKRTMDFVSQRLPADLVMMNLSGDDPPAVTRRKVRYILSFYCLMIYACYVFPRFVDPRSVRHD